jgi:hypothetical protein
MVAGARHRAAPLGLRRPGPVTDAAVTDAPPAPALARWAPLATTLAVVAALLLRAGTSPVDLLRYAAYVLLAVVGPGTLVYRALRRRRPGPLVEDLAMGAAVGLALEVGAWAVLSILDIQGWAWVWPAAVAVPFVAVPRLRRHWSVRGHAPVPVGWSWCVAGVVCLFTAYLAVVFLDRNPILPTSENTRQYLDLAYQLSLAGEATHAFPVGLPQVADEPLYYHWFGHVHMAMTSLVGRIDLPVVALRLAVPALCAAAIVLTAVVGARVSGRPYVGAAAAALFFAVGEFSFTHPVTMPFGTQATFVIWHGMSMIYSWVLLLALIAVLADIVGRAGAEWGVFVLAGVLLFASSGAKASSLPVVAVALAVTAVVLLVTRRRIPWGVVVAGLLTGAAQVFATAVLYRFNTYGVAVGPLQGLAPYWAGAGDLVVVLGVWLAFGLNMLLRTAGIVPLLADRRRLDPVRWFLLAGAVAGPALYLVLSQPSSGNQYFTRAGFTFGVLLSAWGFAEVVDRARLPWAGRTGLAAGAALFALVLVAVQMRYAGTGPAAEPFDALVPILGWAAVLATVALLGGVAWRLAATRWPALRGRGGVVLLTGVLVAGAPGLVMDGYKSVQSPNGGAYATVPMPKSRVDAARWVRDHSAPDDVLATNVHCLGWWGDLCDARSFWLSAYAERSVLVEGWAFAPRQAGGLAPFWDADLLRRNDEAFTAPTAAGLRDLRERHAVRYLVVDREVGREAPELAGLAPLRFDNGRLAVYELP